MRLTLQQFLTLDGVVQAPGGPDEDRSGGFEHGGWSFTYGDEDVAAAVAGWFAKADAFLLGRRTYDIFSTYWPKVTDPDHPIAAKLNALPKFVASRTLGAVEWQGSSLLDDAATGVAELKRRPGNELQLHGSATLAQTLIEHDLVDEYRLFVFPLHVGGGQRLFRDDTGSGALKLTGSRTTRAGVVISTYEPDGAVRPGSYVDA